MSFSPTVVKSTQQGTIALNYGSTTATATITAVDTNKTQLTMLGLSTQHAVANIYQPGEVESRITLTNSTTVTATKNKFQSGVNSTIVTVAYRVVEFY